MEGIQVIKIPFEVFGEEVRHFFKLPKDLSEKKEVYLNNILLLLDIKICLNSHGGFMLTTDLFTIRSLLSHDTLKLFNVLNTVYPEFPLNRGLLQDLEKKMEILGLDKVTLTLNVEESYRSDFRYLVFNVLDLDLSMVGNINGYGTRMIEF